MAYNNAMLSVVIPTLDAADRLGDCLASVTGEGVNEIVVSDGGSTDGTQAVARQGGARVIDGAPGRGGQLARGAEAARGSWLLFLHADTVLAPDWRAVVATFMADPANAGRAAAFRFRLDDPGPKARLVEAIVALRCRLLALPYGDQGLLIPRALYDRIGGFGALPLMEDVDIVRRIGRRRLSLLAADAVTSAARYRRHGYLARMARNAGLVTLFFLGVRPQALARLYG